MSNASSSGSASASGSAVTKLRKKVLAARTISGTKKREPDPLEKEQELVAATKAQRARARADGDQNGGDTKARTFRLKAMARLRQREREAEAELIGGRSAARIAIVGAGPVGLFLAVVLARKHSTICNTANGPVITRNRNAPTIDVLEARQMSKGGGGSGKAAHGTRSIVLAIAHATNDLLNQQLLGDARAFAPTCRIGEIERCFAAEWERYCSAGFGSLKYGVEVADPDDLHEETNGGYDVVFVASGRRSTSDAWREARGLQQLVEGTAACATIEFRGATPAADGWSSVVAAASRALGASGANIFLRPGADATCGWVWLVGLPTALIEAMCRGAAAVKSGTTVQSVKPGATSSMAQAPSLANALAALLSAAREEEGASARPAPAEATAEAVAASGKSRCDAAAATVTSGSKAEGGGATTAAVLPGEQSALEALRTLDASLRAQGATASVTEGSYWRSAGVLHSSQGARGPTLLVGDACCGRPFWLGSTLNGHFADVALLAEDGACWGAWDWAADGELPLRAYLDRMRSLRKCGTGCSSTAFQRPDAAASARLRWVAARSPPRGKGVGGVLVGGAIAADHVKTAAAAEARLRARAVGVDRADLISRPG